MSNSDPRTSAPSGQLLTIFLVAIVAAGVGFGLGHEARSNQVANFGVPIAPTALISYAPSSMRDASVPDTFDTLRQERLRDDDSASTF